MEYSNGFDKANKTIHSYNSVHDFETAHSQKSDIIYGKLVQRAPESISDLMADQYSRDYIQILNKQDQKDQIKISIIKKNESCSKSDSEISSWPEWEASMICLRAPKYCLTKQIQ